jgi:hypothetical protein
VISAKLNTLANRLLVISGQTSPNRDEPNRDEPNRDEPNCDEPNRGDPDRTTG